MDVVYPYRKSSDNGSELRYSLRSLSNINHGNVWVVGESEPWFTDSVNHIARLQNSGTKWSSARDNILAACANVGVSEDFVLMNDDFFIMERLTALPVCHRGTLSASLARYRAKRENGTYIRGLIETQELLKWSGCQEPLYAYNLHIPMVVNKKKMLTCTDFVESIRPKHMPQCLHLRTFYGNYWQLGGQETKDVKVARLDAPIPSGPFLSSNDGTFRRPGRLRKLIIESFPKPSRYEKS